MNLLPDKAALSSLTVWGGFLFAVGKAAEASGLLSPGLTDAVNAVVLPFSGFLALVGMRRAVAKPS